MVMRLYLVLLTLTLVSASRHDDFVKKYENLIDKLSQNATLVRLEENREKSVHVAAPFPCPAFSPSPTIPKSVHKLRPGDIKVVGAMGDSLTAGLGADASTVFGVLIANRGLSWSIGGDGEYEDQETLPNILKKYNPELKGFSVGTGDERRNARFNVAESGSIAADLPSQTRKLIRRMKDDPTVNFEKDWKVITIMTGGNDLCDICLDETAHSAEMYLKHLTTSLDMLQAEVPRAFVNLVETVNVQIMKDLNQGLICTVIHIVCSCAAFPDGEEGEQLVVDTTKAYHSAAEELINSGRYNTANNFTVVVQPFFKETFLPTLPDGEPDLSYFAPDCFHFSRKGQAAAAIALWNNMIEPVGQKRDSWFPGEVVECPTEESPFLFTYKNSVTGKKTSSKKVKDFFKTAFDTKLAPVSDWVQTDDKGHQSTGSDLLAVGCAFLGLALLGLILAMMFRRRRRGKTIKYRIVDDELIF